jgi:hypothetical protein
MECEDATYQIRWWTVLHDIAAYACVERGSNLRFTIETCQNQQFRGASAYADVGGKTFGRQGIGIVANDNVTDVLDFY